MVVWILIFVVIALCTVIIIRDKRIREAILQFFTRIRKKIHVARIKAQINKEKEKKSEILKTLGETAWGKGVDVPTAAEEKSKADALAREKKGVDEEIDRLNAGIEKNKKSFEEFTAKQDAAIKENEEK
ncbi:MAG: hypothetical protein KAW12_16555, partial [Candidatus Aminicenantes bacterium]|nr:hypothetical protein [Candidatus Aminicenantes bacterium]